MESTVEFLQGDCLCEIARCAIGNKNRSARITGYPIQLPGFQVADKNISHDVILSVIRNKQYRIHRQFRQVQLSRSFSNPFPNCTL